jgi:hypothetical protein
MFHTRFFETESEAQSEFEAMKEELARILECIPLEDDLELDEKSQEVIVMIHDFVERFP